MSVVTAELVGLAEHGREQEQNDVVEAGQRVQEADLVWGDGQDKKTFVDSLRSAHLFQPTLDPIANRAQTPGPGSHFHGLGHRDHSQSWQRQEEAGMPPPGLTWGSQGVVTTGTQHRLFPGSGSGSSFLMS